VWPVWNGRRVDGLKESCNCRINGMTVGCVIDCKVEVVVQFTPQSTAERYVNRSMSTDGDAGQM
jgi:hypothetical protein